jgi:protein-tyrosine-phosphatase
MAYAFAEQERQRRGLEESVALYTGGTHPAEAVHDVVVEAMAEVGIDVSDRTPREISTAELQSCGYVATMGCSTLDLGDSGREVDVRDWALEDPHGQQLDRVREIRDDVRDRVSALFDEVEREHDLTAQAGTQGGGE